MQNGAFRYPVEETRTFEVAPQPECYLCSYLLFSGGKCETKEQELQCDLGCHAVLVLMS